MGLSSLGAALKQEMLTLTAEGMGLMSLELPYNPSEFTIHRSVPWSEMSVMMRSHGVLQYNGGGVDTVSFKFVVDMVDSSSSKVLPPILMAKFLHGCTLPYQSGAAYALKRPPIVELKWGPDIKFTGILENFGMNALMYSDEGKLLRAEFDVSMRGRAYDKAVSSADDFFDLPDEDKAPKMLMPPTMNPLAALATIATSALLMT